MSIVYNSDYKNMIEIIIFGDGYPDSAMENRIGIRNFIRTLGYSSSFLVEDFSLPETIKKDDDEDVNISNMSLFFVEKTDLGLWIFSSEGKGRGSHVELKHLIDVVNGMKPSYIKIGGNSRIRYGIFEEVKDESNTGMSAVLRGLIPKSDRFIFRKYTNSANLKDRISIFLTVSYKEYLSHNLDRLSYRSLPFPKCEIDNDLVSEVVCSNNNCCKWMNKIHLSNNKCPICGSDVYCFL